MTQCLLSSIAVTLFNLVCLVRCHKIAAPSGSASEILCHLLFYPNRLIWQRQALDRCRSLEEPCFCRDTLFYKNSRNCNGTSKLLFVCSPHLTQPEARTHSFCQNKHSETGLCLPFSPSLSVLLSALIRMRSCSGLWEDMCYDMVTEF